MIMKEENLNDNVTNDINEAISNLKEKYKQRREYSLGYLDYMKYINRERIITQDVVAKLDNLDDQYQKYLSISKNINQLGL